METKRCAKCGKVLPISEFAPHHKSRDGYRKECKVCTCQQEHRNSNISEPLFKKKPLEGGNPELARFDPRTLINEIRHRGYRGKLSFVLEVVV